MLQVLENKIAPRKCCGGTAHMRTLEGTLVAFDNRPAILFALYTGGYFQDRESTVRVLCNNHEEFERLKFC